VSIQVRTYIDRSPARAAPSLPTLQRFAAPPRPLYSSTADEADLNQHLIAMFGPNLEGLFEPRTSHRGGGARGGPVRISHTLVIGDLDHPRALELLMGSAGAHLHHHQHGHRLQMMAPPTPPREVASPSEINGLLLEEHRSRADLAAWGVPALTKELATLKSRGHLRGGGGEAHQPLEKAELVRQVADARGLAEEEATCCSVCLSDFTPGDPLRLLPCGHRFHVECIDRWLRSKSVNCPLCNQSIRKSRLSS